MHCLAVLALVALCLAASLPHIHAARALRFTCADDGRAHMSCDLSDATSPLLEVESVVTDQCLGVVGSSNMSLRIETVNDRDVGGLAGLPAMRILIFNDSSDCSGPSSLWGPIGNGTAIRAGELPYPLSPAAGHVSHYVWASEVDAAWIKSSASKRTEVMNCMDSFGPRRQSWGRWCGAGHGGFQDCCNGRPCPACIATSPLSPECLRQCPPIDLVDQACASHDLCTFILDDGNRADPSFCEYHPLYLGPAQANNCACDCALLNNLDHALCPPYPGKHPDSATCAQAKSCMLDLFTTTANCYYIDGDYLVCNAQGADHLPVRSFC
jgi:hypothetical protein